MSTTPSVEELPRALLNKSIPAAPERVLVADDEHLAATDLTLTLVKLGYTTIGPARSGAEALRIAGAAAPDIAMLDVRMPAGDGLFVARELFQTMGIPSIIVSAYSDMETVSRASEAGVLAYLIKPIQEQQLRASINIAWKRFGDIISGHAKADSLEQRLEERRVIERAKWILVSRKNVSEPAAFALMQTTSRNSRRKLVDIANEIIGASELL